MDDRGIVPAIVTGDLSGLAAAYDEHAESLYGYCRWMLAEPEDAADAVENTFARRRERPRRRPRHRASRRCGARKRPAAPADPCSYVVLISGCAVLTELRAKPNYGWAHAGPCRGRGHHRR